MDPHFDLAKFVGAASAPVALIIATAIFLSNLGGRYGMLVAMARASTAELREIAERESPKAICLMQEMSLMKRRLKLLVTGISWLSISIILFTSTVILTGVAMLFPRIAAFTILVVFSSLAGATMLAASVVVGMVENHDASRAIDLETRAP